MKFLVFSDLHIHNYKKFDDNGSRLLNCLKVLLDIFHYAAENDIEHILFCGDLFDQQKSLPTEVINKTIDVFSDLFETYPKIQFITISGNHDHSSKNTLNHEAITALSHLDKIFHKFHLIDDKNYQIDSNEGRIEILGVPYYSHKEHFLEMVPKNAVSCKRQLLMIHQTPQHSNDMIPFDCRAEDFENFDFVFCGHIHKHERLTRNFVIVGSPLHRDLGDEGLEKGFLVYDSEVNDFLKINLDYPKFERTNNPTGENYSIPLIEEEIKEESNVNIGLDSHHHDALKYYLEAVGKDETYLKIGKNLLV